MAMTIAMTIKKKEFILLFLSATKISQTTGWFSY
jgi:hypothetical protein